MDLLNYSLELIALFFLPMLFHEVRVFTRKVINKTIYCLKYVVVLLLEIC